MCSKVASEDSSREASEGRKRQEGEALTFQRELGLMLTLILDF